MQAVEQTGVVLQTWAQLVAELPHYLELTHILALMLALQMEQGVDVNCRVRQMVLDVDVASYSNQLAVGLAACHLGYRPCLFVLLSLQSQIGLCEVVQPLIIRNRSLLT